MTSSSNHTATSIHSFGFLDFLISDQKSSSECRFKYVSIDRECRDSAQENIGALRARINCFNNERQNNDDCSGVSISIYLAVNCLSKTISTDLECLECRLTSEFSLPCTNRRFSLVGNRSGTTVTSAFVGDT